MLSSNEQTKQTLNSSFSDLLFEQEEIAWTGIPQMQHLCAPLFNGREPTRDMIFLEPLKSHLHPFHKMHHYFRMEFLITVF